MKIVVFGSQRCRHCKKQIDFLKKAFPDDHWMYLDVSKDKKLHKIASETKVENIPTTIIFDKDWNPVFRQEGTISCDLLFSKIHGEKKIPIGPKAASLIEKGEITSCVLSEERPVSVGETVDLVSYDNKLITSSRILSINKISPKAMKSFCHSDVMQEYHDLGGRKDWAQFIVFGI